MTRTVITRVLSILSAAIAVGAAATLTLLVGRESTTTMPPSPTTSPTATTTSPTTTPTTTTTPPTTTPAPEADAKLKRCDTSALSAALTDAEGAAGTLYSHLVFTNISSHSCSLAGYPGVSFVDDRGGQIGAPVPRVSGQRGVVTLRPGLSASAVFALHNAYVGTVDGCQATQAMGLRVYPPGDTSALFVLAPSRVCANPATNGSASISVVRSLGRSLGLS